MPSPPFVRLGGRKDGLATCNGTGSGSVSGDVAGYFELCCSCWTKVKREKGITNGWGCVVMIVGCGTVAVGEVKGSERKGVS